MMRIVAYAFQGLPVKHRVAVNRVSATLTLATVLMVPGAAHDQVDYQRRNQRYAGPSDHATTRRNSKDTTISAVASAHHIDDTMPDEPGREYDRRKR